jgi:hypothetical protein
MLDRLIFSVVSYDRLNLTTFASIVVGPAAGKRATRRNTVTVQRPRAMFVRHDGTVTIQGDKPANTVNLSIYNRPIYLTDFNGDTVEVEYSDNA